MQSSSTKFNEPNSLLLNLCKYCRRSCLKEKTKTLEVCMYVFTNGDRSLNIAMHKDFNDHLDVQRFLLKQVIVSSQARSKLAVFLGTFEFPKSYKWTLLFSITSNNIDRRYMEISVVSVVFMY